MMQLMRLQSIMKSHGITEMLKAIIWSISTKFGEVENYTTEHLDKRMKKGGEARKLVD